MATPHPLASLAAGGPDGRALAVAKLRALLAAHVTVRATAAALGVHETTVADWLTAWGMREPSPAPRRRAARKSAGG